jgi:hypothetical protein
MNPISPEATSSRAFDLSLEDGDQRLEGGHRRWVFLSPRLRTFHGGGTKSPLIAVVS